MPRAQAEIGVFGGSGFYSFLDDVTEVTLATPFGPPSAPLHLGSVQGRAVAFLPRHGPLHELPPHKVNYRANLWAMRELGVRRVLGPCAAGSLQPQVKPGDVVICDQLVNRTWGREDTYYEGPFVHHVPFADPYCPTLRSVLAAAAANEGAAVHDEGTVVVVQGPRFCTRAESKGYAAAGWQAVNMTQYPEAYLARELGLCYATLALITDYDSGVEGVEPSTMEEIFAFFSANLERLRTVLFGAIPAIPTELSCDCQAALAADRLST